MVGADFGCYALRTEAGAVLAGPLLCVPRANRHIGWLIAPDGGAIAMQGEAMPGIAIPVRLEHDGAGGSVIVQHSLRRRWLLGHYPDPQNAARALGFRNITRDGHQKFRLDPVPARQISADVTSIATELVGACGAQPRFAIMLAALWRGRLRAALADAALRCLPLDELDHLARHLLDTPKDLALLQAVMPGNPWFQRRLPALIAWRTARPQAPAETTITCPEPSADLAGARGTTSPQFTLGLTLSAYARAATPPRRMACILATARNEGAYLLDWIAYHRAIGFDHIFLYTNDTTDGSDDMLRLLADAGIVSWFDNQVSPTTLPQHRAYAHALSVLPAILEYRWTMIADIDEFAGFDTKSFDAMPDYLNWQEQRRAEAIALPWKLHIARPNDVWRDAPCIERFPLRDAAINAYVKMIFRTNLAWSANPHHPEPRLGAGFIHRAESGEAYQQRATPAQTARPSARCAWMSHYAFRSTPEMIMKLARGRADQPAEAQGKATENRIKTFLRQLHGTPLVEDRTTMLCGVRMGEERARLLTIPGLAACEAEVKRAYATRMRHTCAAFLNDAAVSGSDDMRALCTLMQEALAA